MNIELDGFESLAPKEINKADIEVAVADWKSRLNNLFERTTNWATANGWDVSDGGDVWMHEELMQRFDVPKIKIATLRLEKDAQYALFKPKGLWVIGANGRVDVYTSKGSFIIVDTAKRFDIPVWTIYRASDLPDGEPFELSIIDRVA